MNKTMAKIRSHCESKEIKENVQLPPWCSKLKPKSQIDCTHSSNKSNILNISHGRLKKLKIDHIKRVPRLYYEEKYNKTSSRFCFLTKCFIAIAIITDMLIANWTIVSINVHSKQVTSSTASHLFGADLEYHGSFIVLDAGNKSPLQGTLKPSRQSRGDGTYVFWNFLLNSKLKESLSVPEECYARLTQLQAALSRTEYALKRNCRRNSFSNTKYILDRTDHVSKFNLMEEASISVGSGTKEWAGGRATLWGIIPLWRTSPSPYTILTARKLTPGDCWPFIGSHGKVTIELPRRAVITDFSIEHIRPDSANSAPRQFSLQVKLENGSYITILEEEYRKEGSGQQMYDISFKDPLNRISFQILSNHGNRNYTCIYRLQLHGQFKNTV